MNNRQAYEVERKGTAYRYMEGDRRIHHIYDPDGATVNTLDFEEAKMIAVLVARVMGREAFDELAQWEDR